MTIGRSISFRQFLYDGFVAFKKRNVYTVNESEWEQQEKEWYDGFTFGKRSDIYHPWSVINQADRRKELSGKSDCEGIFKESHTEIRVCFLWEKSADWEWIHLNVTLSGQTG